MKNTNTKMEPKPVKERDNIDLLELTLQLHSRALNQPKNQDMHDAYIEARQEMERRLTKPKNLIAIGVATGSRDVEVFGIAENEFSRSFCETLAQESGRSVIVIDGVEVGRYKVEIPVVYHEKK